MTTLDAPTSSLRPAAQVMRLSRMGAAFPTRLSFLPTLLRALHAQNARVTRPVWHMDDHGVGHAVYSVDLGGHTYSLFAITRDLPPEMRTDRVIATAWDSAYVLYDGVPDADETARLAREAPKQEAGRFTERDLVLSRANKSVRLFAHVVEALRAGGQPDAARICETGYLMRTTAVYGNGKFGLADRARIEGRRGLGGPFMAEMLTVWLIRGFTHDLVEHLGGHPLERHLKRYLGVGNATGLGMAPFLVSHPLLLDAWMRARETALARVLDMERFDPARIERMQVLAERATRHLAEWSVADTTAQVAIEDLRSGWSQLVAGLPHALNQPYPARALIGTARNSGVLLEELTVAFLIESAAGLVEDLTDGMATPSVPQLNSAMPVADLQALIARDWAWAQACDFDSRAETAQFWYVSQAKLEPRLGLRHEEPGAEVESPLDIARQVQALARDLNGAKGPLLDFLRRHPEHRAATRRVQSLDAHPYGEIRDNLIGQACRPIDMLRCKLAFFGAAKFDPKSDRWTRITLAQGAPLADELERSEDWWLPAWEDA